MRCPELFATTDDLIKVSLFRIEIRLSRQQSSLNSWKHDYR